MFITLFFDFRCLISSYLSAFFMKISCLKWVYLTLFVTMCVIFDKHFQCLDFKIFSIFNLWSSQISKIWSRSNINQLFVFSLFFSGQKKPVLFCFEDFKSYKGHQWKERVSSKSSFKNSRTSQLKEDVNIVIGLMEWRNNDCVLKPKCGKRMQLRISNMANAINILVKAEAMWGAV